MENKTEQIKRVEHSIPWDVLNDLCSRFIINVPDVAKQNLVRICFQVELAHWFYLDFYCTDETARLKPCGIKEFAAHIFQHVPFLQSSSENLDRVLDEWRDYKQSVPTYGAILLSEDLKHVLLVQSYWAKNSWGFPKGKVNEDEDPAHCAIREVLEETGFDITNSLNRDHFIQSVINDQLVQLYIITGINRYTTIFQPRTRYEIKCCEWFALADLPSSKKDCTPKVKMGVNPNAFFMVLPFVKRVKRWIQEQTRPGNNNNGNGNGSTQSRRLRNKSESDSSVKSKSTKVQEKGVGVGGGGEDRNKNKKGDKKSNVKRQLFENENNTFEFLAPAWSNFKLNRKAILDSCT